MVLVPGFDCDCDPLHLEFSLTVVSFLFQYHIASALLCLVIHSAVIPHFLVYI